MLEQNLSDVRQRREPPGCFQAAQQIQVHKQTGVFVCFVLMC